MKLRLVDRILAVDDASIETEKAISFEEFSLLKPWGRKGAFPESLLLQVAVESAALLVVHRTGRTSIAVLQGVLSMRFEGETRLGDVLRCRVVAEASGRTVFEMDTKRGRLASGELRLREVDLERCFDTEAFALTWDALHASPRP